MHLLSREPCALYSEICSRAAALREAYREIVEPVMGHSRSMELWSALEAARLHRDPWRVCTLLGRLALNVWDARVCVLGPLTRRAPEKCGLAVAVEGLEIAEPGLARMSRVVVGDLDSSEPHTLSRLCEDRVCFLHVHGDNLERFKSVSELLIGNYVPTSQAYCVWPVLGIGGYTDGDRAVLIPALLGARRIEVYGFDFSRPSRRHKAWRTDDPGLKRVKLGLARLMIEEGARRLGYALARGEGVLILSRH